MLELVQDLELAKEEITKERDIYIQEIENIRNEAAAKLEEARLAAQHKPPQPKPAKCKQCELFAKNTEIMRKQQQKQQETIALLKQDLQCLTLFI